MNTNAIVKRAAEFIPVTGLAKSRVATRKVKKRAKQDRKYPYTNEKVVVLDAAFAKQGINLNARLARQVSSLEIAARELNATRQWFNVVSPLIAIVKTGAEADVAHEAQDLRSQLNKAHNRDQRDAVIKAFKTAVRNPFAVFRTIADMKAERADNKSVKNNTLEGIQQFQERETKTRVAQALQSSFNEETLSRYQSTPEALEAMTSNIGLINQNIADLKVGIEALPKKLADAKAVATQEVQINGEKVEKWAKERLRKAYQPAANLVAANDDAPKMLTTDNTDVVYASNDEVFVPSYAKFAQPITAKPNRVTFQPMALTA